MDEPVVPATVSAEVCYLLQTRAGGKPEPRSNGCPGGKLLSVDITAVELRANAEVGEPSAEAGRQHRLEPRRNR